AELSAQRALAHLKPSERKATRADLDALVGIVDGLIAVPIVPSIEDELVQAADALFERARELGLAALRPDELLGLALHRVEHGDGERRIRDGRRAIVGSRAIKTHGWIVEVRLDALVHGERSIAELRVAAGEVRGEEGAHRGRVRVERVLLAA